jgi:hypothetical protein
MSELIPAIFSLPFLAFASLGLYCPQIIQKYHLRLLAKAKIKPLTKIGPSPKYINSRKHLWILRIGGLIAHFFLILSVYTILRYLKN